MKRVVAAVVGLAASATLLAACSDSGTSSPTHAVSSGSGTEVQVDGKDLPGLDVASVTCVKQNGRINVASAPIGGQQGLGIVMTDQSPPTVESLGMVVDGTALAVTNSNGVKVGSAEVKVEGNTYTITGEATGTDLKNPLAGPISKPFTVTVSCT